MYKRQGLNGHKRHCKDIPVQLDESLDLSDMMEEDFDVTSDSVGTLAKNDKQDCESDECKKSKEYLRQRAMTLSKNNALLKQELMTLKGQISEGKENENEPTKLEQILTNMENIPLKSDLHNMV